jgi:hypothetical protein
MSDYIELIETCTMPHEELLSEAIRSELAET